MQRHTESGDGSTVRMTFCGFCGEPVAGHEHIACVRRLELEPPRYCTHCRRRMKVQVTPRGWSADCVEHGHTSNVPPERQ